MCERDSSQAQLMVKDQEPSVTMKGMEKMAEAMNREQLGEVPRNRVHTENTVSSEECPPENPFCRWWWSNDLYLALSDGEEHHSSWGWVVRQVTGGA